MCPSVPAIVVPREEQGRLLAQCFTGRFEVGQVFSVDAEIWAIGSTGVEKDVSITIPDIVEASAARMRLRGSRLVGIVISFILGLVYRFLFAHGPPCQVFKTTADLAIAGPVVVGDLVFFQNLSPRRRRRVRRSTRLTLRHSIHIRVLRVVSVEGNGDRVLRVLDGPSMIVGFRAWIRPQVLPRMLKSLLCWLVVVPEAQLAIREASSNKNRRVGEHSRVLIPCIDTAEDVIHNGLSLVAHFDTFVEDMCWVCEG